MPIRRPVFALQHLNVRAVETIAIFLSTHESHEAFTKIAANHKNHFVRLASFSWWNIWIPNALEMPMNSFK